MTNQNLFEMDSPNQFVGVEEQTDFYVLESSTQGNRC
jgi:hypothetical protein